MFLPIEIWEKIFLYLDGEDLLSCSVVCKEWRQNVNSSYIWNRCCRKSSVNTSTPLFSHVTSTFKNPPKTLPHFVHHMCQEMQSYAMYYTARCNIKNNRYIHYEHVFPSAYSGNPCFEVVGDFLVTSGDSNAQIWNTRTILKQVANVESSVQNHITYTIMKTCSELSN